MLLRILNVFRKVEPYGFGEKYGMVVHYVDGFSAVAWGWGLGTERCTKTKTPSSTGRTGCSHPASGWCSAAESGTVAKQQVRSLLLV